MEYKLWRIQQLEHIGSQLDEMIKALDEIEISIDNVLEYDRCPICRKYTLRPDAGSEKTTLRCVDCEFVLEVPEDML